MERGSDDALRVLVVEDDADSRALFVRLVARNGCEVEAAESLGEARALLEGSAFDVVVTDLMLADGTAHDLLEELQPDPSVEVIVASGLATVDAAVEALRLGAYDFLVKPIDAARLETLLTSLRRHASLRGRVKALKGELRRLGRFGPLVGSSPAMQELYDLIERVAPTDASVLLSGESGTGKELVARAIAETSARSEGPFVALNCGAVTSSLIESRLFGHERGSFTGAESRHRGCFERATGGTLMLDEVTEMSPELQVRLLRVLETRTIQRVGGTEDLDVDVRVIAATNVPPLEAVESGKLREDLYYRLRVFPIELPPLRARKGDVEILARHFLRRLNEGSDRDVRLSDGAMEALRAHSWPGNVRELLNVMRQVHILADDVIDREHLPAELGRRRVRDRAVLHVSVGTPIKDAERRLIEATLEFNDGDKRRTAQELGVSVKTLYNRLNAYSAEGELACGSEEDAPGDVPAAV